MLKELFSKVRTMSAMCSAVLGLLVVGCEPYVIDEKVETSKENPVPTVTAPTNTSSAAETVPSSTASTVLNDDSGCELFVKYQQHDISNDGQVRYVKRVLTSTPFGRANPVCVQYNDTRTGEVTVWKDSSSRGQRVDKLPSDRGINKIVVWFE